MVIEWASQDHPDLEEALARARSSRRPGFEKTEIPEHFERRVSCEDVAESGVLAHPTQGREASRLPSIGIGERIRRLVRGVEVVQARVKRRGLNRAVEARQGRVDDEAASAHRAPQCVPVARVQLHRVRFRALQAAKVLRDPGTHSSGARAGRIAG